MDILRLAPRVGLEPFKILTRVNNGTLFIPNKFS